MGRIFLVRDHGRQIVQTYTNPINVTDFFMALLNREYLPCKTREQPLRGLLA